MVVVAMAALVMMAAWLWELTVLGAVAEQISEALAGWLNALDVPRVPFDSLLVSPSTPSAPSERPWTMACSLMVATAAAATVAEADPAEVHPFHLPPWLPRTGTVHQSPRRQIEGAHPMTKMHLNLMLRLLLPLLLLLPSQRLPAQRTLHLAPGFAFAPSSPEGLVAAVSTFERLWPEGP